MSNKRVLVQLESFSRVVDFSPEQAMGTEQSVVTEREFLLKEIRHVYRERISPSDKLFLQVKDEEWGGVFVDFFSDVVPDKSIFKVILERCDEVSDYIV